MKVLQQKRNDSNKVYSLHEQHVYAIAKGKDHKKYEYGTKASIVTTLKSNIIVGVCAHETNEPDSKTLQNALATAQKYRDRQIEETICDRGYRGKKEVDGTRILIPDRAHKKESRYQREQKRKKFRRRAAIEPIICHLKADHRLQRNYLKGFIGDEINLLLAAAAFNLKKWLNNFLRLLFLYKLALFIALLKQIKPQERRGYANIYPMLYQIFV